MRVGIVETRVVCQECEVSELNKHKEDGHSDETSFETMFEEYPFLSFCPGDIVDESLHLDFLTVWNGGEKVE